MKKWPLITFNFFHLSQPQFSLHHIIHSSFIHFLHLPVTHHLTFLIAEGSVLFHLAHHFYTTPRWFLQPDILTFNFPHTGFSGHEGSNNLESNGILTAIWSMMTLMEWPYWWTDEDAQMESTSWKLTVHNWLSMADWNTWYSDDCIYPIYLHCLYLNNGKLIIPGWEIVQW